MESKKAYQNREKVVWKSLIFMPSDNKDHWLAEIGLQRMMDISISTSPRAKQGSMRSTDINSGKS